MGDEEKQVTFGVETPDYLRPQYANFLQVNHTPWDFRLIFGVIRAPLTRSEQEKADDQNITADGVVEVIIPAGLMHGLIGALQANFSRYLDNYGAPGLHPEGPGQGEPE